MERNKKVSEFIQEMMKRGKITIEEAKTLAKEYTEKGKEKFEDLYEDTSEKIASLAREYSKKGKELTEEVTEKLSDTMSEIKEKAEDLKLGNSDPNFSKKKLDEIIEARLSDIFELIENHLKKIKRNELLPAGVVFVGGGANVFELEELSKTILKLPSKVGSTEIFGNTKTKLRDPAWYVTLGLVNSNKNAKSYTEGSFSNFIQDLKSALKSTLKQLMP